MSDHRTQEAVENLYGLVIEKLTDHIQHGEPVVVGRDEEGMPVVERKLNAQLVKAAIAVAERASVNVVVRPNSQAANLLRVTEEKVDGVEYSFPDETDPIH